VTWKCALMQQEELLPAETEELQERAGRGTAAKLLVAQPAELVVPREAGPVVRAQEAWARRTSARAARWLPAAFALAAKQAWRVE
jgi:hypothetical protein